ncbi:2B1C protein, partial [Setophaga kirtlandii]|nr:2B1C protein [Setophaga kirtlandii]
FLMFDSDLGEFVGDTRYGKVNAKRLNNIPAIIKDRRALVDRFCRHNYKAFHPFTVERRVPPSPSKSIPVHS